MFSILMDVNTKSYYMEPGDVAFHAYSDVTKADRKRRNSRIVETDIEDPREFETMLYNAGFFHGYLDGKPHRLSKNAIYFYSRNPNEISYAQWLLTKNPKYLEMIKKSCLITLCKIDGDSVFFPTVTLDTGETAVLAYTDRARIPGELYEKYDGWRSVKMTFDARCVVNGQFVAE
jgi:hypothetical protein